MDKRFLIETPLMWIDKAATWQMAKDLGDNSESPRGMNSASPPGMNSASPRGGESLVNLIIEHTHTCYCGDREHRHAWGYGCGHCPACELRARGFERFMALSAPLAGAAKL